MITKQIRPPVTLSLFLNNKIRVFINALTVVFVTYDMDIFLKISSALVDVNLIHKDFF